MDLDRTLIEMIDDYISDAMTKTGTRRAPRPIAGQREPELDVADMEPLADLIAARMRPDSERERTTRTFVIDERNVDAQLLAQVKQQLAQSSSAIEPLPRSRAPRSTADLGTSLDDEVTNIVTKPTKPA